MPRLCGRRRPICTAFVGSSANSRLQMRHFIMFVFLAGSLTEVSRIVLRHHRQRYDVAGLAQELAAQGACQAGTAPRTFGHSLRGRWLSCGLTPARFLFPLWTFRLWGLAASR